MKEFCDHHLPAIGNQRLSVFLTDPCSTCLRAAKHNRCDIGLEMLTPQAKALGEKVLPQTPLLQILGLLFKIPAVIRR